MENNDSDDWDAILSPDFIRCSVKDWVYKTTLYSTIIDKKIRLSEITLTGEIEGNNFGLPSQVYECRVISQWREYERLDEDDCIIGRLDYEPEFDGQFIEGAHMDVGVVLPDITFCDLERYLQEARNHPDKTFFISLKLHKYKKDHDWSSGSIHATEYSHGIYIK